MITLTEEIIATLKEANPNKPLYKKTLFNQDFVFTYLTREDYQQLNAWIADNPNLRLQDVEDKMVDYGLLWPTFTPQEWAMLPAGTVPTLAKHIQEKSYLDTGDGMDNKLVALETLVEAEPGEELTQETKDKLKEIKSYPMKVVVVSGTSYVIRPMLRPEYYNLQKLPKEADGEVEGVKRCLVWPKKVDWDKVGAGVPTVLASEIMKLSGFSDTSVVQEL
jgi:hypothetical protein